MPFLIPIFVAVGTAVAGALGVSGVVGGIIASTVTLGLELGTSALIGKLLSPHASAAGSPTDFKADKTAGYTWAVGRCGMAGNIVFEQTSAGDKNKYLHWISILSCGGPVQSIDTFYANREAVTFSSSKASGGTFNNRMWLRTQLGAQPETLLTAPAGTGSVPEWNSTHLLSGKAAYRWILQTDEKVYGSGIPKPLAVGHWAKVWDPRLDSTYPGGSGSQRSTDQTTWAWSDNPFLVGLTWCLGIKENGVRVLGIGATQAQIDVAAFVSGANVADDNAWKVAGLFSSKDSKWEVLKSILQAASAAPMRLGHQISCTVETSRTSLATVTAADFLSSVRVPGTVTRPQRINQVTPKYLSEDHFWDYVDAAPVTIAAYVSADGQLRPKGVEFRTTPGVNQATQLAAYAIYGAREIGPIGGTMKPLWNALKPGDCITIDEAEYLLTSQKMVVLTRTRDPNTGCPQFTFRSETDAKHAAALGLTGTAPPTPSVSVISFTPDVPATASWAAVGTTITNAGNSMQAVVVTGAAEQSGVTAVHVYYRAHGATEWTSYGLYGGSTTRVDVTSVSSGGIYDVGVAYVGRGGEGPVLTLDNSGSGYTAGTFVASGVTDDKTPTAVNWTNVSASGGNPTTGTSITQTIAAINVPIALTLNTSGVSGAGALAYIKNGGAPTTFTTGGTVSMSVGDTLAFAFTNSTTSSTYAGTLTVVNTTDSSTTLDTLTWSAVCSGTDVTPDAVGWGNIVVIEHSNPLDSANGAQTFAGISTAITLKFGLSLSHTGGGAGAAQYSKNGGAWTTFVDTDTLSVSSGDTLAFNIHQTGLIGAETSGSVTVTNTTDANAVLSVFYFDILNEPP